MTSPTVVWFVGFDTTPKVMSKNLSFIYVSRSFLNVRINVIGKTLEGDGRVKLEDVLVKQKGTGGYVAMDIGFANKPMRFFIYQTEYKKNIESLEL